MPAKWNQITAVETAVAAGAMLEVGDGQTAFTGLSTDSRSILKGNLFVALRGDRFDGHDYVSGTLQKGAFGAIVARSFFQSVGAEYFRSLHREAVSGGKMVHSLPAVLVVEDTLKALGDLAAWWRRAHRSMVVGITGSSGKTTAKEMTAAVFEVGHRVLKTQGNFNNLIGLPLTLLGLEEQHERAVLEMGMNRPGEIARLTEIADPDVGVILNVGMAHIEGLGSLEAIAGAKTELMKGIRPNAVMVLHGDDDLLMKKAAAIPRKTVTFGLGEKNDVRARRVEPRGLSGTRFDMEYGGNSWPIRLKVPGNHNVLNALAACAAGIALGEKPEKIAEGLYRFEGVKGRLGMAPLKKNMILVDDTYNANPSSLKASLDTVASLIFEGRRLLVGLGDMLELGSAAVEAHRNAGKLVAKTGAERFFAMGGHAGEMIQGAVSAGMSSGKVTTVRDCAQMAEAILKEVQEGDLIFLKGSRRMGLDRVSKEIYRRHALNEQPDSI